MTEIWFYHLERQSAEAVLPSLVEKSLERDWRVVVEASREATVEQLDRLLWTYSEASFLPHGTFRDGGAVDQPIYITNATDTPNNAKIRICLDGADPLQSLALGTVFARIIVLFDGRDADAVAKARTQWSALRDQQHVLSYWQQNEQGGWQKKA